MPNIAYFWGVTFPGLGHFLIHKWSAGVFYASCMLGITLFAHMEGNQLIVIFGALTIFLSSLYDLHKRLTSRQKTTFPVRENARA